jgi:hypothetical protein
MHLLFFKLDLLLYGTPLLPGGKLMWEVTNACVIMHNMIIESEQEHLTIDTKLYHWKDPLANVDH